MARILLTYQKPDETETHIIQTFDEYNPQQSDKGGDDDDGDDDENDGYVNEKNVKPSVSARNDKGISNLSIVEDWKSSSDSTTKQSRRSSTLSPGNLVGNVQKRKFSFPTNLPSTFLSIESTGQAARRRFSNVSVAVTRKLSSTIGWKTNQEQSREIVVVGKSLCSQYIRLRLKRSGYLNKRCGLQRIRSAMNLGGVVFRDVYPGLVGLGVELERLHPKVYVNITRQASCLTGGKLSSEKEIRTILVTVSRELLKNEITWGKVVSLYAIAGGLAVDCARQGHSEYFKYIVDTMEAILEEELVQWILCKGGWQALSTLVRPPRSKRPWSKLYVLLVSFFFIGLSTALACRYFKISTSL